MRKSPARTRQRSRSRCFAPAGRGSSASARMRSSTRSSRPRGSSVSCLLAARAMNNRYLTRLQPELLAEPLVRDRAPALRERGPRGGEVHQVLELLQPCAVFHRDQRRQIPAVALQDDALTLEDPQEGLREALARVRGSE